jgi:hypothetical protein
MAERVNMYAPGLAAGGDVVIWLDEAATKNRPPVTGCCGGCRRGEKSDSLATCAARKSRTKGELMLCNQVLLGLIDRQTASCWVRRVFVGVESCWRDPAAAGG